MTSLPFTYDISIVCTKTFPQNGSLLVCIFLPDTRVSQSGESHQYHLLGHYIYRCFGGYSESEVRIRGQGQANNRL